MTAGARRGLPRQARRALLTLGLALVLNACGSVTLNGDGGTTGTGGTGGSTGGAGHGGSGATGSAGATGSGGATGSAGATGAAGHGAGGATGGAGSTGAAGSTGGGGMTGSGGSTGGGGKGAGGQGGAFVCGPVCQIYCQYGNVSDANGCPTCACNPAPVACTSAECPAPPPYALPLCDGGPIVSAMCLRGTDGKCAWHAPSCGVCAPANCPNLTCANGLAVGSDGCTTCTCSTCPTGSHAVACPGVTCNIACAYGFANSDGCAVCSCRAAPTCASPSEACVRCTFGYRAGPSGCRTCACEDPPPGCAVDLTGTST